ncbi:hypothetical protein TomTYG75_26110 [Sphingobium sp. TomTYG75]
MHDNEPLDRSHLLSHAQALFPGAMIEVIHTPGEIIHIDVDGHRYTFEIGSDDDEYLFTDGKTSFSIPLMKSTGISRISPDTPSGPVLIEMSVPNKGDDRHDDDRTRKADHRAERSDKERYRRQACIS